MSDNKIKKTYLHDWHLNSGARLVDFAGYALPVSYKLGLRAEHEACRHSAALFDVSHMGQVSISGADALKYLKKLIPLDSESLPVGAQGYSFLLNKQGGILDDLMCARLADNHFEFVVNGACKEIDIVHMREVAQNFEVNIQVKDKSLIALQGPRASEALAKTKLKDACNLKFMQVRNLPRDISISRSGYTGEDGFEISIPNDQVVELASELVSMSFVEPAGLGARDTLRMEAGLPLYGQDLNPQITPLDASLSWAIPKNRENYIGSQALLRQRQKGPAKARIALLPEGRAPLRTGVQLFDDNGNVVGHVTSGTISPTMGVPISLAIVDQAASKNQSFTGEIRGKRVACIRTKLPFVPKSYAK